MDGTEPTTATTQSAPQTETPTTPQTEIAAPESAEQREIADHNEAFEAAMSGRPRPPEPDEDSDGGDTGDEHTDQKSSGQLAFSARQKELLSQYGLKPETFALLPAEEQEALLSHWDSREHKLHESWTKAQAEIDRLRGGPKQTQQQRDPLMSQMEEAFNSLSDIHDKDFEPVRGVLGTMFSRLQAAEQIARQANEQREAMFDDAVDIALEIAVTRLGAEHPSLNNPEIRARFDDEFNKLADKFNAEPGSLLVRNVQKLASEAAKSLFTQTATERSAKLSLVNDSKSRVASQPRVATSSKSPTRPLTEDEQEIELARKILGKTG